MNWLLIVVVAVFAFAVGFRIGLWFTTAAFRKMKHEGVRCVFEERSRETCAIVLLIPGESRDLARKLVDRLQKELEKA